MKENYFILFLVNYVLLVLCALVIAALAWSRFANGLLYRCTDPLIDLWPPFVHPGSDDVYLLPRLIVLTIWTALAAGAFILPAFILWVVSEFVRDDDTATAEPAGGDEPPLRRSVQHEQRT